MFMSRFFQKSTCDIFQTTNNNYYFEDIIYNFEITFKVKVSQGYVLKYLKFIIFQSPLGYIIDLTDNIPNLTKESFTDDKNNWYSTVTLLKSSLHNGNNYLEMDLKNTTNYITG